MNQTNEFSFLLKPSVYGVGVFATHDIKKDTHMRLFGENNPRRLLQKEDIPEQFKDFCAYREGFLICPPDFGYMPVGWYLNHSKDSNTEPRGGYTDNGYIFYAKRDIVSGEEITIDYNTLEEPEETKEDYYNL